MPITHYFVFSVMHVVNDTTELNMTFATHRMVSDRPFTCYKRTFLTRSTLNLGSNQDYFKGVINLFMIKYTYEYEYMGHSKTKLQQTSNVFIFAPQKINR